VTFPETVKHNNKRQMNTAIETKKAQEYISEHKVKHIYAKLLTDATLFRPKDPLAFFKQQLQVYQTKGLAVEYDFPRLIIVLCPDARLQVVVEAVAVNHKFKLLNSTSNEELVSVCVCVIIDVFGI
jgi:hypothetical protein